MDHLIGAFTLAPPRSRASADCGMHRDGLLNHKNPWVSPLSDFPGFAENLAASLKFERLCRDLADELPGKLPSKAAEFLGTLIVSLFHGQTAFSQIAALHLDSENPLRLGFQRAASSARVRRGVDALAGSSALRALEGHLRATWQNDCREGWICDSFSTRKPGGGAGRLIYRTFWDDARGICLAVDVRDAAENNAPLFFEGFLRSLTLASTPRLLRGGEEYAVEECLSMAEGLKIPYIFELSAAWPGLDFQKILTSTSEWEDCGNGGKSIEAILRMQGWKHSRRVVLLQSAEGRLTGLVTSLPVNKAEIARLYFSRPRPSSPFDPNSLQWPWEGFTTGDSESSLAAARLLAIYSNWWRLYGSSGPRGGSESCVDLLATTRRGALERFRRMESLPFVLASLALVVLASGVAVTTNPSLDLPPVKALQNFTNSVMGLMKPTETYVGEDAIDSLTVDEMAPLPDPNVDDVPPLDGERLSNYTPPTDQESSLWRIRPIFSAGITYDDNIFITNSNRKSDFIFNFNAGLALEFGDFRNLEDNYLLLEYLATAFFFNRYTSQNSFDQAASLLGQYRFENLAVQAESRYQTLSGAERQVGAFTDRSIFFNAIRMVYDYSEKTSLDSEVSQRSNYYPQNLSSYYYEGKVGFNYAIFPKTSIGLEGIFGLAQVQESPDMWYQTLNGRMDYSLTGKTMLKATGGIQFNEYVGGGEPPRLIPVFSLGAEHLLFTKTRLSFVAYRNLQASPSIAGQDYIATGCEIGISQEFASKFEIALSTGYENDTYVANTTSTDATRVDNFLFVRPSISYHFLKYMKASLSYEYRTNSSNKIEDTWFDNKVNLELSAKF